MRLPTLVLLLAVPAVARPVRRFTAADLSAIHQYLSVHREQLPEAHQRAIFGNAPSPEPKVVRLGETLGASEPSLPAHATVVVIGAGAAGLTAALELQEAGHNTVVIEQNTHVGGRTVSTQTADGTNIDQVRHAAPAESLQYLAPYPSCAGRSVDWADAVRCARHDPVSPDPALAFRPAASQSVSVSSAVRSRPTPIRLRAPPRPCLQALQPHAVRDVL